ncbi:MAG: hypothetical protein GC181_03825 [Bacteroidetes bacterium]|nr:hypothetical protein [Bacteroidota bacterium]
MELKDVVSISGKPGLHLIVGKRPNGFIVESIDESKKRIPTSMSQKVSILEDISMYTYEGDAKLSIVMKNLHDQVTQGLALIDKQSSGNQIQEFFRKILPDFDESKVYNSDILKLVAWYKILADQLDFEKLGESEEGDDSKSTSPETPVAEKKTKSKAKPAASKAKATTKSAPAKAPKMTQRKMS